MTIDPALLEADEEARRESLNIDRSYIVQAPAGSGKTELLIQRYLKLLGTVDHPEEVLAITFTRKAAAEMQLRVLHSLRNAQEGVEPEQEHLLLTANLARDVLRRSEALAWQIIDNPRRLRIQTLDSLNASVARAQPISGAGGVSASAIVVDAELKALYNAAAAATFDWLTDRGEFRDAAEQVLRHVDTNTWLYIAYLARMLETRDQWLPFIGAGLVSVGESQRLRQRFERSLESVVAAHVRETSNAFPGEYDEWLRPLAQYAACNLRQAGSDDPIGTLIDLDDFPSADADALPLWRALAELLLTKKGEWRRTVTRAQGFPPKDRGEKKSFCDLLEALHEHDSLRIRLHGLRDLPPVRYGDEQWSVLLALFRLLPLAVAELQRLFNESGLTDHIEVALTASQALGSAEDPGDLALLLDYQVRHILVDEMQDTSSAQYRMLEALTGGWEPGDGRTLFCVGDPMQSIYRFRNAEVGQFLLAREKGIGNIPLESLLLRRNFRSGETLVDWFNSVFPDVLPPHDDPSRGAVSYSPAVSVPQHAGLGQVNVWPLFGSDTGAEAERGLSVIRATLEQNPGDDMAVLVRSRTQLPALLSRLRRAGIPYRAVDIDRLTDLPEIIDVLALTRACAHPGDRLAWLAILRAPWIGLDWTDLHALVCGDARLTVWEALNSENRLQSLSSYGQTAVRRALPMLGSLLDAGPTETLRDRIERVWMALGGPAIAADTHAVEHVYRYFDVIEKHEVAGSLPDVAELEAILDLERVSSDVNARLHVLTMHRAKGLQFDHVLLYGMGRIPGRSVRTVLSWFDIPDEHGDEQKIISPVGPRSDVEHDPIHRYIEVADAGKDAYEQGRLLYVACTRARKSLHMTGNVRVAPDGSEFKRPAARSLLQLVWKDVEHVFARAFEPGEADQAEQAPPDWHEPVLRRFDRAYQLPEVPPPPRAEDVAPVSEGGGSVEFHWVGSAARFAGTIVHRWLQLVAEGKIDIAAAGTRLVTERWLNELGVGESMLNDVFERVESAIDRVRSDRRGRWLLSGEGYAELALTGLHDGRIETVVLDRVRIDEDTHWIIDYKTSSHEGGDLAGFLLAESERYRPQLERYASLYRSYCGVSARCALYFPLLQEFVEIDVAQPGR